MKSIEEKGGKYYLIDKKKVKGEWVEQSTLINDEETLVALENYAKDTSVEDLSVYLPCFNPYCKNNVRLTMRQKRDLLLSFQKKYKKVVFVACCPECQKVILDIFNCSESDIV